MPHPDIQLALAQVGLTPDLIELLKQLGLAAGIGLWAWFERQDKLSERKERKRLQVLVEGYLVTAESLARSNTALRKVVTGEDDGDAG